MDEEKLSVFPLTPVSVTMQYFYNLVEENFNSDNIDKTINDLIFLMSQHPERVFYLYVEKESSKNAEISSILEQIGILQEKVDYFYYKCPNSNNCFVQILDNPRFDWEKEVISHQPMFLRKTLVLSNRLKQRLDNLSLIKTMDENKGIFKLEPNFHGFGIDLKALWNKIKK